MSAQEWAGPSHTGTAAAQGLARVLPAGHWRWIYGSRACGSHCLSKGGAPGCRRHKPTILSLWTCSMQSPGPLHHSCSDSFKPSEPDHLFIFPRLLTTLVNPLTWKNELCQFELGQNCGSANRSLKVHQGTARAWCSHPENCTCISWSLPAIQAGFSAWTEGRKC